MNTLPSRSGLTLASRHTTGNARLSSSFSPSLPLAPRLARSVAFSPFLLFRLSFLPFSLPSSHPLFLVLVIVGTVDCTKRASVSAHLHTLVRRRERARTRVNTELANARTDPPAFVRSFIRFAGSFIHVRAARFNW
jgi:hypothetical protein